MAFKSGIHINVLQIISLFSILSIHTAHPSAGAHTENAGGMRINILGKMCVVFSNVTILSKEIFNYSQIC